MKLFACDHCANTLYFENTACEACGHRLGYLPHENRMIALVEETGGLRAASDPSRSYVACRNADHGACNWLIAAAPGGEVFCLACRHNETVPNLSNPANLIHFQILERAKKRLFYSLLRLGLPLHTRAEDPEHGLVFRFLADGPQGGERVMTGHDSGIVTLALAEADDAERERRRTGMGEPYRTLLGHFRHEIGHHYWDILVAGGPKLEPCRAIFGDERADYNEALQRHYAKAPPPDWQANFISTYATAHPWEDFAETWAHYLHLTDTLETAVAFGLVTNPSEGDDPGTRTGFDPYRAAGAGEIVARWVPMAALINNLNRSMGTSDAYPFVLAQPVIAKLDFVHGLVGAG